MQQKKFNILRYLAEMTMDITLELIGKEIGCPMEETRQILKEFANLGWIDSNFHLTHKGAEVLQPYKVDNAII